jgi:penicillin-binding protein 1C
MIRAQWFVLPPAEEFYYRRVHSEYRPMPALRADCAGAQVVAVRRSRCFIRTRIRRC